MEVTVKFIADLIDAEIFGDENAKVSNIATIESAKKGDLTFIANKKYLKYINSTGATAVILEKYIEGSNVTQLVTPNPYLAYAKILTFFTKREVKHCGINSGAVIAENTKFKNRDNVTIYPFVFIDENVSIGENVIIYPNVFIGRDSVLGDNCIIYSNVSIYHNTKIGNNVTIHSGTVVGSDGFGYAKDGEKYFKIPQIGNVVIEDDVEIGAGCTIDRGALNSTIIKKGTKIDNLVQIAHNVEIGENSAIVAQVGISGSSKLGKNVVLAGQVGVAGHLKIGNNVTVGAQSGIGKSVPDNKILSGSPAIEHSKWLKWAITYKDLPDLIKRVRKLEKLLGDKNDKN